MASGVWLAILGASSINALIHGASPTQWLRTALPYFLIAMLVVIGLDTGRRVNPAFIARLAIAAGFVAAVGEVAFWANRRNLWSVDVEYLGLSSPTLVAFGVGVSLAVAVRSTRHRVPLLVVSALLIGLSMSPGTRMSVALLLGLLGLAGPAARGLVPLRKFAPLAVGAVVLTLVLAMTLSSRTVEDEGYLADRLRSFTAIAEQGAAGDASASARALAARVAWETFVQTPVFGVGPGAPITGWIQDLSYRLDSPLTLLAHLGIVGMVGMAALSGWIWRLLYTRHYGQRDVFALAARVAAFALAIPFVIGSIYHEKGLSVALALAVAGRVAETHRPFHSKVQRSDEVALV